MDFNSMIKWVEKEVKDVENKFKNKYYSKKVYKIKIKTLNDIKKMQLKAKKYFENKEG